MPINNKSLCWKFQESFKCLQKLYEMQPVEKPSKRQHQVEEENKRLDEAAKKKQKRQLEEINRLEQAASRKLEKQRKQECQRAKEIYRLEHVVRKKTANEVNHFQEQGEYFKFTSANEVNELEKQKKQECQRIMEIHHLEHAVKKKNS